MQLSLCTSISKAPWWYYFVACCNMLQSNIIKVFNLLMPGKFHRHAKVMVNIAEAGALLPRQWTIGTHKADPISVVSGQLGKIWLLSIWA